MNATSYSAMRIYRGIESARTGDRSPGCRPGDRGRCRDPHRQIHIDHYQPRRPSRGFFFGFVSAALAICAGAPPLADQACRYEGMAYSHGALALMGRIEKVCSLKDGTPTWERA